eukprot:scaffold810_cov363-Prasinococcus_capsulatus_cf.AAC.1
MSLSACPPQRGSHLGLATLTSISAQFSPPYTLKTCSCGRGTRCHQRRLCCSRAQCPWTAARGTRATHVGPADRDDQALALLGPRRLGGGVVGVELARVPAVPQVAQARRPRVRWGPPLRPPRGPGQMLLVRVLPSLLVKHNGGEGLVAAAAA